MQLDDGWPESVKKQGLLLLVLRHYITRQYTSSTRTRRGGSCLKDIYKTFLIYRTCMRRAPAKPVRACTLRKWCPVSHVTFEAPLRSSHFSLHSSHSTLHTSHFTLHTSHSTLLTSHCTLPNPHFTLHCTLPTAHSTLHTSHSTLHTSHSTLHTALFTPHTSHCTLHTPHFISSELFSPYPSSSHLFSYVTKAFMNHFPVLLLRNLHAPCASQARACVLCAKLLQCCCPRT